MKSRTFEGRGGGCLEGWHFLVVEGGGGGLKMKLSEKQKDVGVKGNFFGINSVRLWYHIVNVCVWVFGTNLFLVACMVDIYSKA